MSTRYRATDPVFDALDPQVRNGTISPARADRVYGAVTSGRDAPGRPSEPDAASASGWQPQRLLAGAVVFGAALVMAAFLIASSLAEDKGFGWKTFVVMAGVVAVFAVGACRRRRTRGGVRLHVVRRLGSAVVLRCGVPAGAHDRGHPPRTAPVAVGNRVRHGRQPRGAPASSATS